MSNFKVDFIGIGFPRCGTTWLSKCLSEHPEICFSDVKEAHYFDLDYHYEKGLDFYEKNFSHRKEGQIVGEFTPEYIREPEKCARRIRADFPNTKLIFVMRDPVLRAFSHYRYRKYKLGEYKSFREVIEEKDKNPIISESLYIERLRPFLDSFDRSKILFLIHEESHKNPSEYLKKVYHFLEVDEKFTATSLHTKVNITKAQGMFFPAFEQFLNNFRWTLRGNSFGRMILAPLRFFGFTKVLTRVRGLNKKNISQDEDLSLEEYSEMWNFFLPYIESLETEISLNTREYWGNYAS